MKEQEKTDRNKLLIERINSLKLYGESDNAFTKRCGIDTANFAKFKSSKIGIGHTSLRKIAYVCGVNEQWLIYGKGNPDDESSMASETLGSYNSSPARLFNTKKITDEKDVTIELLKAENNALYSVIHTVHSMLDVMQNTLKQNNDTLLQNQTLMKSIISIVEKSNK